jgi:hypothetical protein
MQRILDVYRARAAPLIVSMAVHLVDRTHAHARAYVCARAGTFLLVDETGMSAGHLSEVGCKNVRALNKLAAQGVVEYDFVFSPPTEFKSDAAVITLSDANSLLHADLCVPLRPQTALPPFVPGVRVAALRPTSPAPLASSASSSSSSSSSSFPASSSSASSSSSSGLSVASGPPQLDLWRRYLAKARFGAYALDDHAAKMVEESIVALRAANRVLNTEQHLHMRLTCARYDAHRHPSLHTLFLFPFVPHAASCCLLCSRCDLVRR